MIRPPAERLPEPARPKRTAIAWWLTLASVLAVAPLHAATAACPSGEITLFICNATPEPVALCTGRGGAPVAVLDGSGEKITGLTRAEHMFGGGGETQIAFNANGTRFILFSRTLRTAFAPDGRNDPKDSIGLLRLKSGEPATSSACAETPGAPLDAPALRALPPAPYTPHPAP